MEAYSHTLAMNDVTVNDNNENRYEMKNTMNINYE